MKKQFAIAVAAALCCGASFAETAGGSLTVSGTVEGAISLTVASAGGSLTGSGTGAATTDLGTLNKYGAAPTGFTLARGASNWTLSSAVGVKVEKANLTSTDYTLGATLRTAAASGITWKLNGSTLSDTGATTLTSTGTYGSTGSYSWDIVVADSAAQGAIDNVIDFTATSN